VKPGLRPLLLGHRGARAVGRYRMRFASGTVPPENTLAAFDYALAQGCDGVEFDVRHTSDFRNVVCHDPILRGVEVAEAGFSQLCALGPPPIPCLEDVVARYADRAYLDIELKESGNEESVVASVHNGPGRNGILVSSFKPEVLLRLHELDGSLRLGYICDDKDRAKHWAQLPVSAFLPHQKLVSQNLVNEVHRQNVQLITWTVNEQSAMRRLAGWGVDGLISDDPKLLVSTFR